jgi:hypothetical protein
MTVTGASVMNVVGRANFTIAKTLSEITVTFSYLEAKMLKLLLVVGVPLLIWLSVVSIIVWVVWHFVSKFW